MKYVQLFLSKRASLLVAGDLRHSWAENSQIEENQ